MMKYETNNKYLMHFNKNHDKLGRFAKGPGITARIHKSRLKRLERKTEITNSKNKLAEAEARRNEIENRTHETDYYRKNELQSKEIQARINRIELENKYDRLSHPGKNTVKDILNSSGKKTAITLLTGAGVVLGALYLAKKFGDNEKLMDKVGANKQDVNLLKEGMLTGGLFKADVYNPKKGSFNTKK